MWVVSKQAQYDIFGLTQTGPKLTCNVMTTLNIMKIIWILSDLEP